MGYFDVRVFSLFLRSVSSCFESFLVRFRVCVVFFALVFIFCVKYGSYASLCFLYRFEAEEVTFRALWRLELS